MTIFNIMKRIRSEKVFFIILIRLVPEMAIKLCHVLQKDTN